MKKPNRFREAWLLHARIAKAARRKRWERYRRHLNRHGYHPLLRNSHNPDQTDPVGRRCIIELPERLDLEGAYDATVTHLANIRRAADGNFQLTNIKFESLRFISPSAALMLASEIDRWKTSVGDKVSADHTHWDRSVRQLLCEMGLFELLHLPRPVELREVINTTFLPFIRGNVDDKGSGGRQAQQLRQQIDAAAGTQIRKHLLFSGLTEAITNVSQHAYPTGLKRKRLKLWWMSAAYSRESNTVVVSFYDHGRTIPRTLPGSKLFDQIKLSFYAWHDGEKIKAAMETGRSSTGKDSRGKGLQNFLEVIEGHKDSELRIFSRRGLLTVTNDDTNKLKYESVSTQTCLHGTLIEWKFAPIKATNDLHREKLL